MAIYIQNITFSLFCPKTLQTMTSFPVVKQSKHPHLEKENVNANNRTTCIKQKNNSNKLYEYIIVVARCIRMWKSSVFMETPWRCSTGKHFPICRNTLPHFETLPAVSPHRMTQASPLSWKLTHSSTKRYNYQDRLTISMSRCAILLKSWLWFLLSKIMEVNLCQNFRHVMAPFTKPIWSGRNPYRTTVRTRIRIRIRIVYWWNAETTITHQDLWLGN